MWGSMTLWSWDGFFSQTFSSILSGIVVWAISVYATKLRPSMLWVDRVLIAHTVLIPISVLLSVALTNEAERLLPRPAPGYAQLPDFILLLMPSILIYFLFYVDEWKIGKFKLDKILFLILSISGSLSVIFMIAEAFPLKFLPLAYCLVMMLCVVTSTILSVVTWLSVQTYQFVFGTGAFEVDKQKNNQTSSRKGIRRRSPR